GPLFNLTFTKGPNAQTLTPPDETYFKDISLEFIPEVTGVEDEIASDEFIIYPNPGQGIFYLKSLKMQNTSLKVYNNSGRLILSRKMNNNSNGLIHQIDLRNQADGIYLIEINDNKNKSIKRIIKN
ncbi:MAG: T9SS type A sorting domain-containing protein, partial [Bacteroidales bacterium]|nr:T9SS type A sorting domain-containing protein [Bacteroidales bacterium]